MNKDIKDYLHLYLGSICQITWTEQCSEEMGFEDGLHRINGTVLDNLEGIESGKLHSRPLSDMTEEEMKELYFIVFKRNFVGDNITHRDIGKKEERWVLWSGVERLFIYKDGDVGGDSDLQYYRVHQPTVVKFLLSKDFDIFGLIDSGLAIDKSKL